MCLIVACIGELVRHKIFIRLFLYQSSCHADGSIGAFFSRCKADCGTISTNNLSPFDRNSTTHDYFYGISFYDTYDSQADTGVARSRFNNCFPWSEQSIAFCIFNHFQSNPVLDTPCRIKSFQLSKYRDIWIG